MTSEDQPEKPASAAVMPPPMPDQGKADDRPPWLKLLHPWSAGLLLTVDNLCFGANAMTGFLATPVVVAMAFIVTASGVYKVQKQRAGDSKAASLFKALVCGVLAGIPWSIAGTAVGGVVLLASGMSAGGGKGGKRS